MNTNAKQDERDDIYSDPNFITDRARELRAFGGGREFSLGSAVTQAKYDADAWRRRCAERAHNALEGAQNDSTGP